MSRYTGLLSAILHADRRDRVNRLDDMRVSQLTKSEDYKDYRNEILGIVKEKPKPLKYGPWTVYENVKSVS